MPENIGNVCKEDKIGSFTNNTFKVLYGIKRKYNNNKMGKLISFVLGFMGGIYTSQNYNIPCVKTEFYNLMEELDKKKK